MATKPRSEQLRFKSEATGEHILDTYLEDAEYGGRTLADLLSDLFDETGNLIADVELRVDAGQLQYRHGVYVDPEAGWQYIHGYYVDKGTYTPGASYDLLDIVTYNEGLIVFTQAVASAPASPNPITDPTMQWLVDPTIFDSHKAAAQASADAAAASATAAQTAQTAAETAQSGSEAARDTALTYQTGAQSAQTASEAARDLALTYQTGAQTAQTASESARDASIAARDASQTAETNSANSAAASAASASAAATSESNASDSEAQALIYKNQAESAASIASGAPVHKGEWDASGGTLPPTPGSEDVIYIISVAGTLPGVGQVYEADQLWYTQGGGVWFAVRPSSNHVQKIGDTMTGTLTFADLGEGVSVSGFGFLVRAATGGGEAWLGNATNPTHIVSSVVPQWNNGTTQFDLVHVNGGQTVADMTVTDLTVGTIFFENGDHQINNNDGKGNFNFRVGHQADETYSDNGSGAIHMEFSHEVTNPTLNIHIGEDPTGKLAGEPVVFSNILSMQSNGTFTWGGSTIWHSGNLTPSDYMPLAGGTFTSTVTFNSATYDNHIKLVRSTEDWSITPSTDGSLDIKRNAGTGTARVDLPAITTSGTITENGTLLSAKYLGISANAASATKLATARTISLTGDVTGSASFDGSANISISASFASGPSFTNPNINNASANIITMANNEKSALTTDGQLGFDASQGLLVYRAQQGTTGAVTVLDGANVDAGANISITNLGTGGSGTEAFVFSVSGGSGSGLDADLLDGQHGSYYRNAGNLNAGTVPSARLSGSYSISITGNAATCTTASNANALGGKALGTSTTGTLDAVPYVQSNGVMEIGRYIDFHTAAGDDYDWRMYLSTTAANPALYYTNDGGTLRFEFHDSGLFRADNDVVAYYSDERLKNIVGRPQHCLDDVMQWRVIEYYPTAYLEQASKGAFDSTVLDLSLSAQSVQQNTPEAVAPAPFDIDEDGNSKSGENYLTLKDRPLIAKLVGAVQELTDRVKELEHQLEKARA